MLHAALAGSPHPHAVVLGIDVASVLHRPGVLGVLTAADLPGPLCAGPVRPDRPVLAAGVVRYSGEPVAAVLARDAQTAAEAAAALAVSYRELPEVPAHLAEFADPLHPDGNVLRAVRIRRGPEPDWSAPPAPVPGASVVVDGAYGVDLGPADRPEIVVTALAAGSAVTVTAPRRWSTADVEQIAACLGLDPRLLAFERSPATGPGGDLEDLGPGIVAAALALRHGATVRLVLPARGLPARGGQARATLQYRHHATTDGTLIAVQAHVRLGVGAFTGQAPAAVAQLCATAIGPYKVPAVDVDVAALRSTEQPALWSPAAGALPTTFAVEAQLDRLADRLGLDREVVRLRNLAAFDDPLPTGQLTLTDSVLPDLLAALDEARTGVEPEPAGAAGARWGEGLGLGFVPFGSGEGADVPVEAEVRLVGDGLQVRCAAAEGADHLRALAVAVAARAVDGTTVFQATGEPVAGATGPAVAGAVQAAVDALTRPARERLAGAVGLSPDLVTATAGRLRSFDDLVDAPLIQSLAPDPPTASAWFHPTPSEPLDDEGQGDAFPGFSYAAARAVVRMEPDGAVEVVRVDVVADCGRVHDVARTRAAVHVSASAGVRAALPLARVAPEAVRVVALHDGPGPKSAGGVATGAVAAALRAAVLDASGSDSEVLPLPGVAWS